MTTLAEAYEAEGIAPPTTRPVQHEHNFQQAAFNFAKRALPGVPVWSIDCGWPGHTRRDDAIRANRLRRGVLSGYPDLWIILCPIITFETKPLKDGRLSDAQLARRDELIRQGHHWFGPTRTLEEIEAALLSLDIPLKATTGVRGAVPQVGKRREASYARLNDPVPF